MEKAVLGIATSEEQASRIIDRLLSSRFSNEDISIISPDQKETRLRTNGRGDVEEIGYEEFSMGRNVPRRDLITEKHTKAPEGGVSGTVIGGILGGILGLLAGIGSLSIPGLGSFIAAGPIMSTLSGTAIGGLLGLIIGALIGLVFPEYEAKNYDSAAKAGNIVISVHANTDEEIVRANEIMKKEGAKDISTTREKVNSRY
jgi:hypothetical protein